MPTVRISGRSEQASHSLAEELRNRGFEVLTAYPGLNPAPLADVEIYLKDDRVQEALKPSGAVFEGAVQNAEADVIGVQPAYADAEAPSDWPIWQPLLEEVEEQPAVVESVVATQGASTDRKGGTILPQVSLRGKLVRIVAPTKDRLFLRIATAAAGAALFGLLFVAMLHRFSPISDQIGDTSVQSSQGIPFERTDNVAEMPENPAVRQAAMRSDATPVRHRRARSSRTVRRRREHNHPEAAVVAKNTIVRHGAPSSTASAPALDQNAVKHYSDLR